MKLVSLSPKEVDLILGGLNFWMENKQCEPSHRSDGIDAIVTNGHNHDSLSKPEVAQLIEDLNCGSRDALACDELTPEQQEVRGAMLASVFYLKKDFQHKDRFQTSGGTKTSQGVFVTAKRIIEQGE